MTKRGQRIVDIGIAVSILVQVAALAYENWTAGFIAAGVAVSGYMLGRPWGGS